MKSPIPKAVAKKNLSGSKKATSKKTPGALNASDMISLAGTSFESFNSFMDYQKEKETTKRAQIEGQRDIILGEQELQKAEMNYNTRMKELSNEDNSNNDSHEQAMTKLRLAEVEADKGRSLQDRVLSQLEAKVITAEEAAILLYGSQE
ncbi:hypothetical protein [Serratia fonticola]|uniref:hypothetical protein n=1 Tax=Serratia fonticola TaxID=47917 RepID=UPI0021791BC8|nr:hypothetical protein [Serratia fonticola]CAI1210317.1 Uncharacterised protein [Serratia fonticola]